MKKTGFTLAEVLITLGIVGVVSALVLPTFTTKMQTAKIGPRLAKAVAGFEQANIAILDDAQADALSGATLNGQEVLGADDHYLSNVLTRHMKGSFAGHTFYSADGVAYCFARANINTSADVTIPCNKPLFNIGNETHPHLNKILANQIVLMIDIDADNGPGRLARDRFLFQMMDDGSLRPRGGSWEPPASRWNNAEGKNCPKGDKPGKPALCAGHVMENGLKVEYK